MTIEKKIEQNIEKLEELRKEYQEIYGKKLAAKIPQFGYSKVELVELRSEGELWIMALVFKKNNCPIDYITIFIHEDANLEEYSIFNNGNEIKKTDVGYKERESLYMSSAWKLDRESITITYDDMEFYERLSMSDDS